MDKSDKSSCKKIFQDGDSKYPYLALGKSSNPPLVVIYGFTGDPEDLLDTVEPLKTDYFVIIPELPGWNDCERLSENMSINAYARYIKKLCDHLKLDKIVIMGHCFGAVVAVEFSALFPKNVENLILVSVPYLEGTLAKLTFKTLANLSISSPRAIRPLFFTWRSRLLTVPLDLFTIQNKNLSQKLGMIKNHIIRQSFQDEDSVEENWISLINYDFTKIEKISTPTHFIHGKKDFFIKPANAMKLQKLTHSATFDIIPNAGHLVPLETPENLAELIRNYI